MSEQIPVIGWREWLSLPDLGVDWIKAKVDTGARSSSLHAVDFEYFDEDGQAWVGFVVHPWQASELDAIAARAPLHDEREVRSSTGEVQRRPVIRTTVQVAGRGYQIDLTLTDRADMRFRMLLGREAVRHRFLVHPGRSHHGTRPPRAIRRRNREADR